MTARILSGKSVADAIKTEVAAGIVRLESERGFRPCLTAIRVGDDASSAVYVNNKVRTAAELGIISGHRHLPGTVSQSDLLTLIKGLNACNDVDGILVQLPLPKQIAGHEILEAIDPQKDVDGFHPINVGRLSQGVKSLAPCTPAGVIEILKGANIGMAGRHAVVVGRSNIVGKPLAMLFLNENATVTVCHSQTRHLASITKQAEILVAAIGKPGFLRSEHIRDGATVVDVGINNVSDLSIARELFGADEIDKRLTAIEKRGFTLVGDVNPREAKEKAGAFTPVPGGVGLVTVAMLMKNTFEAAKMRRGMRRMQEINS